MYRAFFNVYYFVYTRTCPKLLVVNGNVKVRKGVEQFSLQTNFLDF